MSTCVDRLIIATLCSAAAFFSGPANCLYVLEEAEKVPVERLITNLQAALDKNPGNVRAVLNLARTHAMAYSRKTEMADVRPPSPPPPRPQGTVNSRSARVAAEKEEPQQVWSHGYGPQAPVFFDKVVKTQDPVKLQLAQEHLSKALALYKQAAELAPENLVVRLGLAWLTEQAGNTPEAMRLYRDVVAKAWALEQRFTGGELGQYYITSEAARYLLPLLDPAKDKDEIASLKARTDKLGKLPRMVTPIAIPLKAGLQPQDLEDRSAAVGFDADGSGIRKQWTWITADAAWLVYLPDPATEISSALQWFGGVTFWLFWDNGYQALGALDDDRDGQLEASELDGLALWHDANGNGVSESGEIKPLAAHGISALSYDYQIDADHRDRIAFAPDGVTYIDGSTRASYDLILHPVNRVGSRETESSIPTLIFCCPKPSNSCRLPTPISRLPRAGHNSGRGE